MSKRESAWQAVARRLARVPGWLPLVDRWRRLRRHYWLALGFDVIVLIAIFASISAWQSHHLLATDGTKIAPDFHLPALNGKQYQLAASRGKTTLVYFFAPWCHVCALSAGNVEALRAARDTRELDIYMVALSYDDVAEVEKFVDTHMLSVPVLLGNVGQIEDYRIRGFPTYYVIDPQGRLRHRAVGYSTEIGLRWRTW